MPNIAKIQKAIDDTARLVIGAYKIPAIAAVLVNENGSKVLHSVQGLKDASKSATAASNKAGKGDFFNVGSISKPITGLFIAALIKRGDLKWDTKISDVFTEFKSKAFRDHCGLNSNFLNTKLYELISHSSGMGGQFYFDRNNDNKRGGDTDPFRVPEEQGILAGGSSRDSEWMSFESLRYQRYLYTLLYMKKKKYKYKQTDDLGYNNKHATGYSSSVTIATAMAERKLGRAWELIMTELLFHPLPMEMRFGAVPNGMQHHSHDTGSGKFVPNPSFTNTLSNYSSKFMTGAIHCTVEGMAQYIRYNIRALTYGQAFDVTAYQKPVTNAAQGGLFLNTGANNNEPLWHVGTTGGSRAVLNVYPHTGAGYAVMMNCVDGNSQAAMDDMSKALADIYKNWNTY